MSCGNWAVDLDSIIFTRIKNGLTSAFGKKYTDMYITNSDRTLTTAKFPTIYIHPMSNVELGNTLDGNSINGVMYTIQCEVTVTESQSQAKTIMAEILNIVKAMYFEVIAMPEVTSTDDTYRAVARFRRAVGASDTL